MNKWFYQWFLHSAKCLGTKLAALCSQSWGKRSQGQRLSGIVQYPSTTKICAGVFLCLFHLFR